MIGSLPMLVREQKTFNSLQFAQVYFMQQLCFSALVVINYFNLLYCVPPVSCSVIRVSILSFLFRFVHFFFYPS